MLLATASGTWHVAAPLLPFDRPPVGVGDLTSGVFLATVLRGFPMEKALEHTAAAYHAVMSATKALGEFELQTVAAQDSIASPPEWFPATRLD
mmetsp:Transcript_104764/g.273507  ORF Transcript_104764/g.273507 Transcript_104764/m.273507 type:complete len:93 (-) Transcript_104764:11-289(-)